MALEKEYNLHDSMMTMFFLELVCVFCGELWGGCDWGFRGWGGKGSSLGRG